MKSRAFAMGLCLAVSCVALAACSSLHGEPGITVREWRGMGKATEVAVVRAEDEATRREVRELWKEAERIPENRRILTGPDASHVEIRMTDGKRELAIVSWHPIFERNPKLVVTSHGVEALDGRTREEMLKADKAWYREARATFDKITAYAKAKGGKAANGRAGE